MDWVLVVVTLVFMIRGLVRGTIRQVFGLVGVLMGLWAAGWVSQWVGAHWQHARPAVVFWVLRWLVAGLAGLAVASLSEFCGNRLHEAVKASALGILDRLGGALVGVAFAWACITLALLVLVSVSWPREPRAWAAASLSAGPLLQSGARVSEYASPVLPRGPWLRDRFSEAGRRVVHRARPA